VDLSAFSDTELGRLTRYRNWLLREGWLRFWVSITLSMVEGQRALARRPVGPRPIRPRGDERQLRQLCRGPAAGCCCQQIGQQSEVDIVARRLL
jgi:hypothetical protein